MSFTRMLTRTAQGNALINSTVIPYHCRFAYDYTAAVVDNKSLTNGCARVNLDAGQKLCALTYCTCRKLMPLFVKCVCHTV